MFATQKLSTQEALSLLDCRRLPGRVTAGEAAVLLGFQDHDVPVLCGAKLLKPLGEPAANSPKHFASAEVEAAAGNTQWLSRATKTLARYWRRKNARKNRAAQHL